MANTETGAVLVTGAPRSGTTIIGKLLAKATNGIFLWEPFNQKFRAGIPDYYPMLSDESPVAKADFYNRTVANTLECRSLRTPKRFLSAGSFWKRRFQALGLSKVTGNYLGASLRRKVDSNSLLVVKDPIACFLSECLIVRHEIPVIVCVRNPASLIQSRRSRQWVPDAAPWLLQNEQQIVRFTAEAWNRASPIERECFHYETIYTYLLQCKQRHPHKLMFVSNEQLCLAPAEVMLRCGAFLQRKVNLKALPAEKLAVTASHRAKGHPMKVETKCVVDSNSAPKTHMSTDEETFVRKRLESLWSILKLQCAESCER